MVNLETINLTISILNLIIFITASYYIIRHYLKKKPPKEETILKTINEQ